MRAALTIFKLSIGEPNYIPHFLPFPLIERITLTVECLNVYGNGQATVPNQFYRLHSSRLAQPSSIRTSHSTSACLCSADSLAWPTGAYAAASLHYETILTFLSSLTGIGRASGLLQKLLCLLAGRVCKSVCLALHRLHWIGSGGEDRLRIESVASHQCDVLSQALHAVHASW